MDKIDTKNILWYFLKHTMAIMIAIRTMAGANDRPTVIPVLDSEIKFEYL